MSLPMHRRTHLAWHLARIAALTLIACGALPARSATVVIDYGYSLAPHETFIVPAADTVVITTDGSLRADGRYNRIGVDGVVNSRGAIRAGFNSEGVHGVAVGGTLNILAALPLEPRSVVTTMNLSVSGSVVNGGSLNTGIYARPDGSVGPFFSSPVDLASWGVLFSVDGGASIVNQAGGTWANRGDGLVLGTVRNDGLLLSSNSSGMVTGGAPYAQLIRIGDARPLQALNGMLFNAGRIELHANNSLRLDAGVIDNLPGGEMVLLGGELRAAGAGIVTNAGRLEIGPGSFAQLINGMTNFGTVDIASGGAMEVGRFVQPGGDLRVNGTLTGIIEVTGGVVSGGATYNPVTGSYQGGGTINGDVYIGGVGPAERIASCTSTGHACLDPGNSPGQLTIRGMLTMDAFSVLELEVGRAADGMLVWDTLFADGVSFLEGSLIRIVVDDDAADLSEHLLDLIHCGDAGVCDFSGARFELVGAEGDWSVDQGLQFRLAARQPGGGTVPSPGPLVLLSAALPALSALRRRRAFSQPRGPARRD